MSLQLEVRDHEVVKLLLQNTLARNVLVGALVVRAKFKHGPSKAPCRLCEGNVGSWPFVVREQCFGQGTLEVAGWQQPSGLGTWQKASSCCTHLVATSEGLGNLKFSIFEISSKSLFWALWIFSLQTHF